MRLLSIELILHARNNFTSSRKPPTKRSLYQIVNKCHVKQNIHHRHSSQTKEIDRICQLATMVYAHSQYDDRERRLRPYFKRTSRTYCKSRPFWKRSQRKLNGHWYCTANYHRGYQRQDCCQHYGL